MHRPTRKLQTLQAKLARKLARGAASGKLVKRAKKWLEAYKGLAVGQAD
ncbi:MAG: hypothetical protein HY908_01620 [Myxococcales bacterium]|nr:hypothetical protein [Myxococcales bacterium]MCC6521997.1 hypothetical protein [Polyangiaceae bacterium]